MDRITPTPAPGVATPGHTPGHTLARRGFTLIELLVVISIIALLVGILLPALGAARRTAQNSQCLSNIKQMNTAAMAFAADHRFHVQVSSTDTLWVPNFPSELRGRQAMFPDQNAGNKGRIKDWASAIVPYMGGDPDDDFENADTKVSKAFICPSDPGQDEAAPGYQIFNNISGGSNKEKKPISYGVNADATTYNNNGAAEGATWATQGATLVIKPFKGDVTNGSLDEIRSTSNTMLFADCGTTRNIGQPLLIAGDQLFYSATAPLTTDPNNEVSGTLAAAYEHPKAKSRIPISENQGVSDAAGPADRHGDKINVAYADGHAASSSPDGFSDVYLSPHK
jgi:prepilin-type N-terminal cleavage/methylation domain-containing protein/prepilin-type processing-associated H-X9-DG protein